MAILAINEVEDYFNDHDSEYKLADSYRRAARWLTCVAILGIFFHCVMVFVRCLYLTSYVKSSFTVYAYLVSGYDATLQLHMRKVIHVHYLCIYIYNCMAEWVCIK